jgi:hypothetical protein
MSIDKRNLKEVVAKYRNDKVIKNKSIEYSHMLWVAESMLEQKLQKNTFQNGMDEIKNL